MVFRVKERSTLETFVSFTSEYILRMRSINNLHKESVCQIHRRSTPNALMLYKLDLSHIFSAMNNGIKISVLISLSHTLLLTFNLVFPMNILNAMMLT